MPNPQTVPQVKSEMDRLAHQVTSRIFAGPNNVVANMIDRGMDTPDGFQQIDSSSFEDVRKLVTLAIHQTDMGTRISNLLEDLMAVPDPVFVSTAILRFCLVMGIKTPAEVEDLQEIVDQASAASAALSPSDACDLPTAVKRALSRIEELAGDGQTAARAFLREYRENPNRQCDFTLGDTQCQAKWGHGDGDGYTCCGLVKGHDVPHQTHCGTKFPADK